MPVQPPAIRGQEERSFNALADRQVSACSAGGPSPAATGSAQRAGATPGI
jgi:hypothetical protein